ncbi:MAG: envelope biogenesis factor ElyC [Nitrospiraceae bacterium]|nr:envelope biogenesis factor ElyC [Nitrospiraceae bacterium]
MFLLKKIISPLFLPVPICLEILLTGLVLLWFTRRQKLGKVIVSIGVILLASLSFDAISNNLLRPLEHKYPPLLKLEDVRGIKWIVVLGGGHQSDPNIPSTSQLSDASIARLVEGIRLYRMLPGSKLILSGGSAFDPVPDAGIMADVARAIGVNEQDLILESVSRDTKDEARLIQEIVGKERFILVTSAFHMPRSMALFEKHGMRPIPAPTEYLAKESRKISPSMFFPSADSLEKVERAFHEYLGLGWAKLRGQI